MTPRDHARLERLERVYELLLESERPYLRRRVPAWVAAPYMIGVGAYVAIVNLVPIVLFGRSGSVLATLLAVALADRRFWNTVRESMPDEV